MSTENLRDARREVRVNGIRVVYTDCGAGIPIFLMHGNPDTRHSWEPLADALGDGFRIIAPDFPGFGESEPLPDDEQFGRAFLAGFWNSFIDEIGLAEPVNVVVHDFGGPWALPWVAAHPDRVRSLFVLNTLFQRDYPWHIWARFWQWPVVGELTIALLRRPVLRREMKRHSPRIPDELIDESYDYMHSTMRRTVLRTYRAYARPDQVFDPWEERLLEAIESKPVRVLWGDLDPAISTEFADRYGVEATHLPDYGHWPHLENPEMVANTLREFLVA